MITATHIDTAYAELRSAMRSYQEWAQLLAEAKHTLETAKLQGLGEAVAGAAVAELEAAGSKAQLVLDLANLEVERIRLHLRYQEVTLLAARQALSAEVAYA